MVKKIKELEMMKILIVGGGGREHALAWKMNQSSKVKKIYVAPGNVGTADFCINVDIKAEEIDKLLAFAQKNKIDLTVVGPELPLAMGIVDIFEKHHLPIFGPSKKAAEIESSKVFAKRFMKNFGIPTADFKVFSHYQKAKKYLTTCQFPKVIKADGLTAGKGSFVCQNLNQAQEILKKLMVNKEFGKAGEKVVIENYLIGQEASLICLTDGKTVLALPLAQDYKRLFDKDKGPNTGGMGAYAPSNTFDKSDKLKVIFKKIILPTIWGLEKIGRPFKGVLYAGLMLTKEGPRVLEFNCRFGDPETQAQLMLLKSDLLDLMLACLEGKLAQQKIKIYNGTAACIIMASRGYPERYETGFPIRGLPLKKPSYLQIFHAGTKKEDGKILTNGGRVLGVTVRASNLKEAVAMAYRQVKKISFKNQYYRTDIGKNCFLSSFRRSLLQEKLTKVNRLEINYKIADARAEILKNQFKELGFKINKVWIGDVYTINKTLKPSQLKKIAEMFVNPAVQTFSLNKPYYPTVFDYAIEIGYLPGVTDNVAQTAKESIEDLLKEKFKWPESVHSSQIIYLKTKLLSDEVKKLIEGLINPLIQRAKFKNYKEYQKDNGMDIVVPQVKLTKEIKVTYVDLNISEEELQKIGKEGISESDGTRRGPLALDLTYMKAIKRYFEKQGRQPTDIELESIAQTWSEHCKHTIFNDPIDEIKEGLFKAYIKKTTEKIRKKKGKRDICVSVFKDNSGAITFDKDWLITDKVETHNSPSALDPFGGAITGIVGVNRDAIGFGLGAKPIINRYGFCFADPNDQSLLYKGPNFSQKMLSSRKIMEGVIKGVNKGGNCSGIPTPQGFVFFDESFKGKPLVFVGTVGLIPRKNGKQQLFIKKARPGDYIVMVGGRVGLDGIHGATFSSEALDPASPAGAVQIGDPITQKKLSDVLIKEARDLNLYTSITDNGAGGLSCSVAEMAKEAGGCEVELEKVPLKYPGLAPWQIWISESQERMTLAVPPKKWGKFFKLLKNRGVEATVIGRFTNSGKCLVKYQGKKIMDIHMDFLHHGLPSRARKTAYQQKLYPEPEITLTANLNKTLLRMLGRLNIASFEFISSQYDHEVQGGSVIKPLQGAGRINGEATVVQPVLASQRGIVISQGLYPTYSQIDPYHMAACSLDTAIRNTVSVGGNLEKLVLLDNICWCSSNEPERLGQLKRAVQACYDYALAYETPFISGKDSMFNDFKGFDENGRSIKISVLPTLLISSLGIIEDINKVVSLDVKFPGDLIYVLGETFEELGGSEYLAMQGYIGNRVPQVNAQKNKKLYQAFTQAIKKDLVVSAISVTRGGLGIALAKMAMGGMLGIEVFLKTLPGKFSRDDFALFSESQGRILVTVDPKNKFFFEKIMKGNAFAQIGRVIKKKKIIIKGITRKTSVSLSLSEALKVYRSTFKNY